MLTACINIFLVRLCISVDVNCRRYEFFEIVNQVDKFRINVELLTKTDTECVEIM